MEAGDVAFFHGGMVHCSVQNITSKVRFNFVTRYYRMLSEDFFKHSDVGEKITGFNSETH